jgi:predicted transposase YbfD/YdcC
MRRQAATARGIKRRIDDLELERVKDPRCKNKTTHSLCTILTALIAGMTTLARSLRKVEERTEQMAQDGSGSLGIQQRIADNTFGKILARLEVSDLMNRLHAQVKAEHRRGNLKPTVLKMGTVAIDGKNVATLRWYDICRLLDMDEATVTAQQVKARLAEQYPTVQFCVPGQGKPYALARVHTVTLISSNAAVCVHQRPTAGHTNEVGSMPQLLDELDAGYGRCGLFSMITTDAGNTSIKAANKAIELKLHYFMQIKCEHGQLYNEATRILESQSERHCDYSETDSQNGDKVIYRIWHHDLSEGGCFDWTHARQFVRVQRIAENARTGKRTEGNRYYVSSRSSTALGKKSCLKVSRAHWRCEDETHWTADAILQEDRRQLSWSRHPTGVLVVSALRMMALNILSVARKLSRVEYTQETPSWQQVAEHFVLALCGSILITDAFDNDI